MFKGNSIWKQQKTVANQKRTDRQRADRKEISQWLILGRSQVERGILAIFREGPECRGGKMALKV
jgi:hypothetical protein